MKTIILGCTDNPTDVKNYFNVSWAWNELGWNTLMFYSGKHSVLLDEYKKIKPYFNDKINQIMFVPTFDSYNQKQVVNIARMLSGGVFSDNRLCMIADLDIVPMKSTIWNECSKSITRIVIGEGQYDLGNLKYILATSDEWRMIVGIGHSFNIDMELKSLLDKAKNDEFYLANTLTKNIIHTIKLPEFVETKLLPNYTNIQTKEIILKNIKKAPKWL